MIIYRFWRSCNAKADRNERMSFFMMNNPRPIDDYLIPGKRVHLVGIGGVMEGLETGEPVVDGNKTPASEYMERFAGYDISAVWEKAE